MKILSKLFCLFLLVSGCTIHVPAKEYVIEIEGCDNRTLVLNIKAGEIKTPMTIISDDTKITMREK